MTIHNIINVLSPKLCGAEKIVVQLHDGLLARGMDSHLIALVGDPAECGFDFESLGLSKDYGLPAFAKVYSYIRRNCSNGDIIHAHLFPTMLYVSLATRMLRRKLSVVCTEHSTNNRRRGTLFGKIIDHQVYAGYQKIFCISGGVADALGDWMPGVRERMVVVENGVELPFDSFVPRERRAKIVIASVGRLHRIKNYETALKALSLIKDIDFEYWIAGSGPLEERLKALSRELGLTDKVRFMGYVADVAGFLRQVDVFLIPSLWEGFGLAAVEAMNAGLPIIASDVKGLKEIVGSDGSCGELVDPRNPQAIAGAVALFSDLNERLSRGRSAFERSLKFSAQRMIDSYVKEYKNILQPLR